MSRLSRTSIPNSHSSPGISKSRRRRPNNKLSTNLSSLLDVLPSLAGMKSEEKQRGTAEEVVEGEAHQLQPHLVNKILQYKTSLRMKPGALKKKEKIAKWEMKEFNRNLAASLRNQMPAVNLGATSSSAHLIPEKQHPSPVIPGNHWAGLRKHISSTMEQYSAFSSGK